ncbi:hypothetical protein [Halobacterium sp. KA-6]|uniref:hypothetical protein n=1 Tax=Halobacterium sp. KA-6 TaxID=2896368 RepID=UPI001E50DFC3|nr:hypothetical protein [Halobacterium sp. KA-6]MCD2204509.1 hypothetical protein [Halobacterium sp. KA-6]
MLEQVHNLIDESKQDNWQVYLLLGASGVAFSEYAGIYFITGLLHSLDGTVVLSGYTVDDLLISACQGSFIAILGNWMFSQGDSFFAFGTDSFNTKEVAVLVRVGLMTLLGVLGGLVIPDLIHSHAEFVVVQTFGLVILIGYSLVHTDIVDWNISNEIPVIVAGFILAGFPFVV